jgi:hypothetical protein
LIAFDDKSRFNSSNYCCDKHDPNIKSTFTDELREDVRNVKGIEVLEMRDYMDAYTLEKIPFKGSNIRCLSSKYEFDHILELHSVGIAIDQTTQYCPEKDRMFLLKKVKEAVNSVGNLAATTQIVNKQKYDATIAFNGDYLNDRIQGHGFVTYLRENGKLSREVGRNIQKEILNSYDTVVTFCNEENSLEENFVSKFHDMTVKMKLM